MVARLAASLGVVMLSALSVGGLLSLAVWSIARRWRFPDVLPAEWTLATWSRQLGALAEPAWTTLVVALSATLVAFVLVAGCLENENRRRRRAGQGRSP